ncbi:Predicted oxidoreductase [Friedmanniella luteola]|uniref:Predicted oxidoreductase n=1 Tax=Friedmanniella luteola TaxID=546871 RepID=A0A1H1NKI1_9ACTN|nr:aldo/keto reductase [Friedmanniella luteola]SDR99492.1 Predicted oxidoreductase [Friedmanniella luteola]
MPLTSLRTLGRSGLPVSPLTLGAMTLGNDDWGSGDDASARILHAYVDAGGNAVDTADVYSGGRSEELLGRLLAERGLRDRVVLATKYGFRSDGANPLAGGAGRKNLVRALEGSLRRLGTDYVDLYWLHVWDRVTPAEEVLQALTDLVRAGKIRYYGFSDLPAWFATRVATLAQAHGLPAPVGLQVEYSLVERTVEREHVPAARALGMGVVPWSPLAGGFLAGKYERGTPPQPADGRLGGPNPFGDSKFTERNFAVLDVLREVAAEVGRPPAQVALAWLTRRPGVGTVLVGARTEDQLTANVAALEVELSPEQTSRLDRASAPEPAFPYPLFSDDDLRQAAVTGAPVAGWDD